MLSIAAPVQRLTHCELCCPWLPILINGVGGNPSQYRTKKKKHREMTQMHELN